MPTYYVDSAATGAADGTSETDAWTTIDTAMNNVIAGDKVWVKASSGYTELANIDTAGAFNNWIEFEGYTTATGDGGKVSWTGTTYCLTDTPSSSYYVFKNFTFTGGSSGACFIAGFFHFYNCDFNGDAFCGNYSSWVNCEFYNSVASGLAAGQNAKIVGCKFYAAADEAISFGTGDNGLIYRCLFYNNGTNDSYTLTIGDNYKVVGNTFDGDGTTGNLVDPGGNATDCLIDNIFHDATGAFRTTSTSSQVLGGLACYNLFSSITNRYYNGSVEMGTLYAGWGLGGDITGAPAFIDEAGDDYRPSNLSPAVDAQLKPGGIT